MSYSTLPSSAIIPVETFTISTPQSDLDDLRRLIQLSRIPKATYENTQTEDNFGITREWLVKAKEEWLNLDWRAQEERINRVPAFIGTVKNEDGREYKVHFAALFSKKKDARAVVMLHGWPGCFLEFLPLLEHVESKWSDEDLPYHLIVPSLPGWLYSSPPPLDKEFGPKDIAYLVNGLMVGLGFDKYIAHGGDIGSFICDELAQKYDACTGMHVNMRLIMEPPKGTPEAEAAKGQPGPNPDQTLEAFQKFGYALEQATRPGTVGLAIGANPISLLAWIGEKYREWSDESPSIETILSIVTLYWLTDTYPSSIYTYRYNFGAQRHQKNAGEDHIAKPMGYSLFKHEIAPTPVHWVEKTGNLVWSNEHEKGGHFAALERPKEMWDDIEQFVQHAWDLSPRSAPS